MIRTSLRHRCLMWIFAVYLCIIPYPVIMQADSECPNKQCDAQADLGLPVRIPTPPPPTHTHTHTLQVTFLYRMTVVFSSNRTV